MNRQRLEHCNRCHGAIKSDTHTYDPERPVIIYQAPQLCNICKDPEYDENPDTKKNLPSEHEALLCKCRYPGCEKEFYSRPTWYNRQQSIVRHTGNPYMPILIDPDQDKVDSLIKTNGDTINGNAVKVNGE